MKEKQEQPIDYPVHIKYLFYKGTRHRVDALNLAEAADDLLVEAGILADDNSNIVCITTAPVFFTINKIPEPKFISMNMRKKMPDKVFSVDKFLGINEYADSERTEAGQARIDFRITDGGNLPGVRRLSTILIQFAFPMYRKGGSTLLDWRFCRCLPAEDDEDWAKFGRRQCFRSAINL